jgi:Flp pilus assembly protein TadD
MLKHARKLCLVLACGIGLLIGGCKPSAQKTGPPPAVVAAVNRGVSLMGQYQYDQAVQAFEEALKLDPELAEAKIDLAVALFNRGRKADQDLERAGQLLQAVLRKQPDNARALYFQGILCQHAGKSEPAAACFEKVARLRPRDGSVWYLLGVAKQRIGQPAEPELLRAIQLKPYLTSAYYKLSQMAMADGDTNKATQYLEQFKRVRESPLAETIELPQYNQMGDLAVVQPLAAPAPPITRSRFEPKPPRTICQLKITLAAGRGAGALGGLGVGDLNKDGAPDLAVNLGGAGAPGRLAVLLGSRQGAFRDATAGSGLEGLANALACALGDYDNDGVPDLFVAGAGGNYLFKGKGDGAFADVTRQARVGGGAMSRSAIFLDADHDGDLDIFVCNSGLASGAPAPNQLWNNNGDGTFTDITAKAGVACADRRSVAALPGDFDGDRDTDLLVLFEGQPARLFLNDLSGKYHEAGLGGVEMRGDLGGVAQDFNGDGALDLLVLGASGAGLQLFLGDGAGHFQPSPAFDAKAIASHGPVRGFRVVDIDLDGDLDVAVFSQAGHLLLNDSRGRFVWQPGIWKSSGSAAPAALEVVDVNGDFVPDLLSLEPGAELRLSLSAGELSPPGTALGVVPDGVRSRDLRTRSPASGFGVKITARTGLYEHSVVYQGLCGGPNQLLVPAILGLDGASKADYVSFQWPDGVAQVELGLAAGQVHRMAELQRKVSSCPVLFAWNGERFQLVTDFAGVGGLGYYSAPGVYAPPQVLEHVKIEPGQLRPRQGFYELRVHEPMEEAAYVDQLELLAIDHPAAHPVFPDERLAIGGPAPTHELLVVDRPLFPIHATGPAGTECAERLRGVDRTYAYDPPLDRRYCGFCQRHSLELDFGEQLGRIGGEEKICLFVNGFIEYPYSQTVYAASQSRIGWEPIRVEQLDAEGRWRTLLPDAGAPGGMGRTFTIALTGRLKGPGCKLRLTTNLEIYYDQVFLSRCAGRDHVQARALPLGEAELRRAGFPREYSPDGRLPLLYDYELMDATAPFHVPRGAYTRYGDVKNLLEKFDDQYALLGPGDELALRFGATGLPPLAAGLARSFVLVSHAYCKDMDLYTATPQTLEPLPFRGMSQYPYPPAERYPDTPETRSYRAAYNTRVR